MLLIFKKTMFQKGKVLKRLYSTIDESLSRYPPIDNISKQQIYDEKVNLQQNHGLKSLKVAILGLPNVGKSTLINRLVHRPICATSSKVQTTQEKSDVLLTENNSQLIFVDTPGILTSKDVNRYELNPKFISDVENSIKNIDCAALVQDVSNLHPAKINQRVRILLEKLKPTTKTVLVLNKVDKVKKKKVLLDIVTTIKNQEKAYPDFSDYFMVSALEDDGINDLREYFFNLAQPKLKWTYQANEICGDSPHVLIQRAVRAKLMEGLPNEIPYNLSIELEHFSNLPDDSMLSVIAVKPPSNRIGRLVVGVKGKRIKQIVMDAEQELSVLFRRAVRIKIFIKFSEDKKLKIERGIKEN